MTKMADFFSETIIQCTSTDSMNRQDAKKLKSDFSFSKVDVFSFNIGKRKLLGYGIERERRELQKIL
jgi:hypothetical protein